MSAKHQDLEIQTRIDHILARLREEGFRVTPQRLAVLEVLAASENHPSVEAIYDQVRRRFSTISLATVYKTISLLKEIHEVLELGFADRSSRYDGHKPYPHPHLICTRCGRIQDPELSSLEELTREATTQTGFEIVTHRLDFFGLCNDCRCEE
ncbi:MAG: transcriptional repressor [Acidobacteria bacterium]|nr:transcriptional repressor [Acidobacteriota bacterium]